MSKLAFKKIYTYFEDIGFESSNNSLLNLWKESWKNQGFDAIVLTQENAEQSPYYEKFVSDLKQIHLKITGKEMRPYGLSCYLRWLAYSTQTDLESVLVSDYDVINKSFKFTDIVESTNKISFMDRYCPCLAYGTPEQFLEFCKDLIAISSKYAKNLKTKYVENKCVFYHDQEFLWLNFDRINYNICAARKYIRLYEHKNPSMEKAALFHIANRSVDETKQNFSEFAQISDGTVRVLLAKDLLKDIISDEILNEATQISS